MVRSRIHHHVRHPRVYYVEIWRLEQLVLKSLLLLWFYALECIPRAYVVVVHLFYTVLARRTHLNWTLHFVVLVVLSICPVIRKISIVSKPFRPIYTQFLSLLALQLPLPPVSSLQQPPPAPKPTLRTQRPRNRSSPLRRHYRTISHRDVMSWCERISKRGDDWGRWVWIRLRGFGRWSVEDVVVFTEEVLIVISIKGVYHV